MKDQINTKSGQNFQNFKAINYRNLAAMRDHFIKVDTGSGFIHLKVLKNWGEGAELIDVQLNKSLDDDLVKF